MHGRRTTHWSYERSHPLHQQLPVAPQREVGLHEPRLMHVGILRSLDLTCAVTETVSACVFLVIPPKHAPATASLCSASYSPSSSLSLMFSEKKDAGFSFGTVRATILHFPSADLTGAYSSPCSAAVNVSAKCQTHIPMFVQQALCHSSPQHHDKAF